MKKFYLIAILATINTCIKAQQALLFKQDTIQLTIKEAEDSFLQKNLSIIAQNFSIDSARASIITAKLYDNPEFSYSTGFYQPQSKKFFDFTNNGRETSIQLSQLFKTAGKRSKVVQLATSGVDIAQFQFYDLIRTLRSSLRTDMYNIYFLMRSEKLYQLEINSLRSIVPAYEKEEKKGYIALKDVLRIKSQLYTLEAEYNDLQTNIDNIESEVRILLRAGSNAYISPSIPENLDSISLIQKVSFESLIDSALLNRPDLKGLKALVTYSKNNLILQKALAKPDFNLNLSYDRQGSYVKYFNAIGISLPIPVFNRNQGNIKSSQIQTQVSEIVYQATAEKVSNDISTAYWTAVRAEKLLQSFDPSFDKDLEHLIKEVFKNFNKRNVTMLEFLDFYESYKQNFLQLNKLRFNKANALEQLNFLTGRTLFNK